MTTTTTLSNNTSPLAMIAPEDIAKFARDAMKTMEANAKSDGTAQQKLCMCILAQHERDLETPPTVQALPLGVPILATLTTDAKIAAQYRAYLKLFFVGKFDVDKKYANEDAMNNARKAWSKRNTILQNAIKLAVALTSASGGVYAYDNATSLFSVHPSMLLPKDGAAVGQLAKRVNDNVNIPLDNVSWRYESGKPSKIVTVQASIAQIVRAHDSRMGVVKAAKAADASTEAASTASGPKIDTHDMSFGQHLCAAAMIVKAGGAIKRNDLSNDEWNALVSLVQQYDAIQGEPMPMPIAA